MYGVDNFKIDPHYKSINQTTHYWFHIYDLEISFIFRFHSSNFVCISQLLHKCYMANLYHPHKQKNQCKNNFSRQSLIKRPNLRQMQFHYIQRWTTKLSITCKTCNFLRFSVQITNLVIYHHHHHHHHLTIYEVSVW